jgi:GNAT superfamily N-acetyltransferase
LQKVYEPPLYLATVEQDGEVAGCAWRTPPYKLGLTRMPSAAMPLLVDDLAEVYETLPAVLGAEAVVAQFADLWSQKTGARSQPGMRQRIYELTEVKWPKPMPSGSLRTATPDDEDVITDWIVAFGEEAGMPHAAPRQLAQVLIGNKEVGVRVDAAPVTMAATTGHTPHGARIGYVYTPPEHRRRGYASACTAALSQQVLDAGRCFCFLYTNLANPTSNRIYQHIGYQPVCDVMDYDFRDA